MITFLKCVFTAAVLWVMVYISGCAVGSTDTGSNVPDTSDTVAPAAQAPTSARTSVSIPQLPPIKFNPATKRVFCTAPLTAPFVTSGLNVSLASTVTFYLDGSVNVTATLSNGLGYTTQTAHHVTSTEQLFVTLSMDVAYDDDSAWWSVGYNPITEQMTVIYNDFDLDGNPYNGVYAWTLKFTQCAEQAL